jgi:hypothetical protein
MGKSIPGGINEFLGIVHGEVDIDELVVISTVFDASVNKGYRGAVENVQVTEINGRTIKNLDDVKKAFESAGQRDYYEVTLSNRSLVVLDRKQVDAEQSAIRERYDIGEYQP